MRVLFVGDIFGRTGRAAVARCVPLWRRDRGIDFVIGNGENSAGGYGVLPKTAQELFDAGIDVITLGNHTWDHKETRAMLSDPRILRPHNYPPLVPGTGVGIYNVGGVKIAVVQLMGRHNLVTIDCPFRGADALLKDLTTPIVFVDMHAEATSEKQAMGWYLNGRVSAVLGTHTHTQTADERVLPGGTAYITDVGMAGPRDGVIGGDREKAIERFLTGIRVRLEAQKGDALFCAVVVDVDETTGRARSIERVAEVIKSADGLEKSVVGD